MSGGNPQEILTLLLEVFTISQQVRECKKYASGFVVLEHLFTVSHDSFFDRSTGFEILNFGTLRTSYSQTLGNLLYSHTPQRAASQLNARL